MEAAIQAVLTIFLEIVQASGAAAATGSRIASIVDALLKLTPVIVQLFPQLISSVKGVIAALEANDNAVPDQIAALKAALPASDADFADAVAQAEANDAAAEAAEKSN